MKTQLLLNVKYQTPIKYSNVIYKAIFYMSFLLLLTNFSEADDIKEHFEAMIETAREKEAKIFEDIVWNIECNNNFCTKSTDCGIANAEDKSQESSLTVTASSDWFLEDEFGGASEIFMCFVLHIHCSHDQISNWIVSSLLNLKLQMMPT